MGLDVYVGSLTRYTFGGWLTIVQQAGLASGMEVQIVRSEPDPDDLVTDPDEIHDAVLEWRSRLGAGLGVPTDWVEEVDSPYWTDKPDWDGYGAVVLAASYDERPDLRPSSSGLLRRRTHEEDPRRFQESPAYRAAAQSPARYPSLLSGAEWWLPVDADGVWEAPRLTGEPTRMASVHTLAAELATLTDRTDVLAGRRRDDVLALGSPEPGSPFDQVAAFGLAVFLGLAEQAVVAQQPLLLDY